MYRLEVFDSNKEILAKKFDSFDVAYEKAEEVFFFWLPREIANNAHFQIRDTVTDHITSISFVRV